MKNTKYLLLSALLVTLAYSSTKAHPPVNIGPIIRATTDAAINTASSSFTDALSSTVARTVAEASQADLLSLSNVDMALQMADERAQLWQNLGFLQMDDVCPFRWLLR